MRTTIKTYYQYFFLIAACLMLAGCPNDDGGMTDDQGIEEDENGITDPAEVVRLLNESLIFDRPTYQVDPDGTPVDNSIIVSSAGGDRMPLHTGEDAVNTISFQVPAPLQGGGVTAVGMRFGPSGPITFVELTPEEAAAGIASFVFQVDPALCEDISRICHDIRCYEFAQTASGAISQADLQDIALVCGACDEPSCLSLLDEETCNGNGMQGADGDPRFNLTWTGSTDLDLYVTDPNGDTISYINTTSASGGALDVDCTGNCAAVNAENIFWGSGGPSGTYQVYVNYFGGSGPTPFTLVISDQGQVQATYTGSVNDQNPNSTTWSYQKN